MSYVNKVENQEDWDNLIEKISFFVPSPALRIVEIASAAGAESTNDIRAMNTKRRVTTVFINFNFNTMVPTNGDEAKDQCLMLQTLFSRIVGILEKDEYDGMVRQFLVDDKGCNFIGCFGGPNHQHDDDPARGLGFALQLLNEITYVKMGIGVTTGEMFCGCVGNLGRREYAFVGDDINMAARLMMVGGVDILCDHATYTSAIGSFDFNPHDLVLVKGREEQMEVYEPVSRKLVENQAQWNPSFVGRVEEKRKIIDCLYNKSIVAVSAPEGYGKSRLLQYSSETARKLGFSSFACSASKMHQQVTYFAIGQLVKQILRLNTPDYNKLEHRLKVLYVEQQITYIVEKFRSSSVGNSRSIFNIETSTRFEKPRNDSDRRGSLESVVGRGRLGAPSPDARSNRSTAGSKMANIGEVIDNAVDEDDSDSSDGFKERASTGTMLQNRRSSSFAALSVSEEPSSIERHNSAGSLASSGGTSGRARTEGLLGVQPNGTVLQSSLDRYRKHRKDLVVRNNQQRVNAERVSIFAGSNQYCLSQPKEADFDDNGSKASVSDIMSMTSMVKSSSLSKTKLNSLEIADFLYLMQSAVDLGISAPQTPNIAEMSSIARAQTLAKFFYYLVSSQKQSVFIVDEAQWLDSQSWMMLEKLTRRAKNICLIITGRKHNLEASSHMKSLTKSPRMVNINMSALDAVATASLASSMTKDSEWPPHIIDLVVKSTEGVPKQTVGLLETLLIMKQVEVVDETCTPAKLRFADTKLISKTVASFEQGAETAMMMTFDGLDVIAQSMLKVAAVFGSHFTCDMIIDLLPFAHRKDPAKIKAFYIMLCAQDWLRVDNIADRQSIMDAENVGASYAELLKSKGAAKTFSFSEDRTRKILYKMVPEVPTRQNMHAEAARCIQAFYFDDLQAIFPILAYHYKMGGEMEDEVKACQMAAQMSTRQGHLAEGIRFLTRCLELAEAKDVKFLKFEHFDKGSALAEWSLSLAQCEYAFGRVEKTRSALLNSLKWLQISVNEKLSLNLAAGTKDLNKIFTSLAKHLFMNSPGKKISVKSDKLNSIRVKTVGFLFILSMLDMDEESTIMYGVNLANILLDLKSEQGTYAAVLVCSLLKHNASGMVARKAASYIFGKLEVLETNSKWFKETTWAVIGVALSMVYYGSDLEKAVKLAKSAFKKTQTLNTTIGHVESLQVVTACELSEGNTTTVNRNITLFSSLTKTLDNPTSKVWESASLIRKFQVGSLLLESDEYRQIMNGLETVRKVTRRRADRSHGEREVTTGANIVDNLPKAIQLDAFATEASAVLILGMQEPEYWQVSFECAKRGLEIMKAQTYLPLTYSKDSFVGVTATFLHLYKELLAPEASETSNLKYKDEVLECIGSCQKCLEMMLGTFPLAKPIVTAVDEIVNVIKGGSTPKKCEERLSAIKLGVGKFCKNDAMFIESLSADIQGFAEGQGD